MGVPRFAEAEQAANPAAYVEPRWYACYTRPRSEKRVSELLPQRGIECYLPTVPMLRQWKDRKKRVDWPLFPSYVFGRFALRDTHAVLTTPGIATLVRLNGAPIAIPDEEMENVRQFAMALAAADTKPELRPYVNEGQWVQVVEGPFRGVRGVVVQRKSRRRVMIGISAIRQGFEVDIDTKLLKLIPEP